MDEDRRTDPRWDRRRTLARAAALGVVATDVTRKGSTRFQRTRPQLPGTPCEVVDRGALTTDGRLFLRRHRDVNPEQVGAATVRLAVKGRVGTPPSRADPRDGPGGMRGACGKPADAEATAANDRAAGTQRL